MIWYLLLALFPVVAAPIVNTYYKSSINNDDKAKRVFLLWCGIVMFLMLGLRSKSVGSDDPTNYYNNWIDMVHMSIESISSYAKNSEMEVGYLYFVGILSKVFPDMTEGDWENVKLSELMPLLVGILKGSFVEILAIPTDQKNAARE